jgi:hypothetical protein
MNKTLLKQSILMLSFLFSLGFAFSQAPEKLSYQSVIRRTNNDLVVNQNVRVKISILQGTISGTAVYVEDHSTSTNSNGLVSLSIGGGNVISGTFSAINWENGPYFVKMEADPTGGTNYTVSGTSQLLSVPYALHAKTAESIVGGGTTGGFTHYIGEQYGGGLVFHLWKDAQGVEHGLIVDLTDLSTSQDWSNVSDPVGITARSSWDGLSNSISIVSQVGHTNSAAAMCLNSSNGGQNDWYLPSIDELVLLFNNRFNVNKTISSINNANIVFDDLFDYWSSTESISVQNTVKGMTSKGIIDWESFYKSGIGNVAVRAIRSF